MMGVMDFHFSELAFLRAVVVGVLLLIVLRLLRVGLRQLGRYRRPGPLMARSLPVLEATVGLLYVFWALGSVLERGVYYNAALFMVFAVVALLLAWFAARDWMAGIVLKVEDGLAVGQRVRCADVEGAIRAVGHLSLEVEVSQGEAVKIPYSRMSGQIRARGSGETSQEPHCFQIAVEGQVEAATAMQRLREAILNSPWSAVDREPQIRVLEEGPTHAVFEAVVHATGLGQAKSLEHDVRGQLGAVQAPEAAPRTAMVATDEE